MSTLYVLQECFNGPRSGMPTHENVLGVLLLIVWYLVFVTRGDHRGETWG